MKILLITLLTAASCAAQAQYRTGNELLADMRDQSTYKTGFSLGYVMGVADAGNGVTFCLPSNVTAGQVSDMVRNTLIDTPAVRHIHAASIVDYVLSKAWPCKKGASL